MAGPGRAGPPGGARWPANWHFADPLIGHCARKLHYGPRPPSNVIQKNERNKGRERLSACYSRFKGMREGRKGGKVGRDGQRYDYDGVAYALSDQCDAFLQSRHLQTHRHPSLVSNGLVANVSSSISRSVFFSQLNLARPSMIMKC